jgi:predicted deacylase
MKIRAGGSILAVGQSGVVRDHLTFANPALAGHAWPVCEIAGRARGPRLCVSAGVHVNEVSSIEAAIRLQSLFEPDTLKGTVSILPLVNQPAYGQFTEYDCPIDAKNIQFSFPGNPRGSFSEALCDALQTEWAANADCYVDLHGGDLRENVAKFVMFQRTDDPELNARGEVLARCFDAEIVVGLPTRLLEQPGRATTAFARQGRIALTSEAGANGILDEASITFHVDGVLNIAHRLGMIDRTPRFERARVSCHDYLWVKSPANGQLYPTVEPGDAVVQGQDLGAIHDLFGERVGHLQAPADGLVLWRMTHPTVVAGTPVLGLAVRA